MPEPVLGVGPVVNLSTTASNGPIVALALLTQLPQFMVRLMVLRKPLQEIEPPPPPPTVTVTEPVDEPPPLVGLTVKVVPVVIVALAVLPLVIV